MAEPAGPFRLLRAGPGRFLCYCRPGPGPGGTRCPPGEHGTKLRWVPPRGDRPLRPGPAHPGSPRRAALGRGTAALSLGERPAVLQLRGEAPCSALQLFKLPVAEARSQLQALLFGMAGRVESLERRLEGLQGVKAGGGRAAPWHLRGTIPPAQSPRKNRGAVSALPAKRKIPGESLINPGFKSKKAPSGVDFEDS
ncbi:PAXX protein, partial [Caloenas nicobarica]|nr:PAXX protein [Caloenas nicobarica]